MAKDTVLEELISSNIKFMVNGKECTISPSEIPSDLSLARYLREYLHLTGTKISCNQGGCGACTVAAAWFVETGNIKYKSLNSCITPVLSCGGWSILTVEGLASGQRGTLNPVQERLAAFHGSQCGFCTPGMVMQMCSYLEKTSNDHAR